MRTTIPDETGWYWCKDKYDEWYMAFVDTNADTISFWDGDDAAHTPATFDSDASNVRGIVAWYGPFVCPGGDFGGATVIPAEEQYEHAKAERKAVVIQFFDYKYCRDEGHGSSLTISGVYDREEADKRIRAEVKEELKP